MNSHGYTRRPVRPATLRTAPRASRALTPTCQPMLHQSIHHAVLPAPAQRKATPKFVPSLSRKREPISPQLKAHSINVRDLVRAGKFDDALFLLKQLEAHEPRPNVVMYHMVINALAMNRRVNDALEVITFLESQSGRKPDAATYNSLVAAYAAADDFPSAMEIYERMRRHFVAPTDFTFTHLLKAATHHTDKIPSLLGAMQRQSIPVSEVHYNWILRSYAKAKKYEFLSMYFEQMLESKVPLNEHSYSALITGFADARRPDKIMELYRVAKLEEHLNEVVGTQLLQAIFEVGTTADASEILTGLKERNAIPTAQFFSVVYSGLLKNDSLEAAEQLWTEIVARGIKSVYLSTTRLKHLLMNGNVEAADALLESMLKDGPAPTVNTFNCYLHGILRNNAARPGEVNDILAAMKTRGLQPDSVTYSSMITFYLRQGDDGLLAALRLLTKIEDRGNLKGIACCFNPVIAKYFELQKPELAEALFARLKRQEPINSVTGNVMLNGFLAMDDPESAEKYLPFSYTSQNRSRVIESWVLLQRPERAKLLRERWDEELERRKSMPLTLEAKLNAALDKAWQVTK